MLGDLKLLLTLGIEYTKEPSELNAAVFEGSVVVKNARIEVSKQLTWICKIVWVERERGSDICLSCEPEDEAVTSRGGD